MAQPKAQSALARYLDMSNIGKLTAIGMEPRRVVEGCLSGNHRSPFHGFAVEFAGHRQYAPGDEIKHIDWKAYYKQGRYLLKQYTEETNFICHLMVDVSETMTFKHEHMRKIDYTAFMACSMSFLVQDQSDMASCTLFDNKIREYIPRSNAESVVRKISAAIEKSEKKHDTALGEVITQAAEQYGRRGIVMIFSDFFGDLNSLYDGLKRLIYSNHEVVLFHVLDPVETTFNINGTVEFVELEGTDRLILPAHQMREAYLAEINEYLHEIFTQTRKLGVEYVRVSTAENFGVVMARYLNERMRMGAL